MTVVEDFAADYFVREGITEGRRRTVLRALRDLERIAGAPPETLDERAVDGFVTTRVREGLHINSVRTELKALKPFYGWCWRNRIISADLYLRIKEVKPPRGSTSNARPRPYRRKEIQQLWADLDSTYPLTSSRSIERYFRGTSSYPRIWRHAMNLQMHAIVSLALFGGLRQAEIRTSGMDDIHPDNEFVVVRGKSAFGEGQGYREVPYTVEGRAMVAMWLNFRARLNPKHDRPWLVLSAYAQPNNYLLPSHPLDPMAEDRFKYLMAGVGKGWELHRLRHTCATEWLRAGMPIEKVSRLLGHANLSQTQGYVELVREDVAREMRRGESDFTAAVGRRAA